MRSNHLTFANRFIVDASGQSLVEAAIAFPILLLAILGIMQMALLHNAEAMVRYAAFCAARTAIVFGHATPKGKKLMEQAAAVACSPISDLSPISRLKTQVSSVKEIEGGIEVEVTHYYRLMLPFAHLFFLHKADYSLFPSILPGYYVPIKAKCIINSQRNR